MNRVVMLFSLILFSFFSQAQKGKSDYASLIQPAIFAHSKVMMHDVVNPPAASRYYAYGTLGAYAIVAQHNLSVVKPEIFIRDFKGISINTGSNVYDYRIAALYCILETGRLMLPSGYMIEEDEANFIKKMQSQKVSTSLLDSSIAVAKSVAAQIIAFSKDDHYNRLSALIRYTPIKGDGYWYPTPPAYIEAVEPNWKTIRPLIIDSCNQFMPSKPVDFSKDSNSTFYRQAYEVYDCGNHPKGEEVAIAAFWDCNPFAVETAGHMAIGFKKISPGGHWMSIGCIAAQDAKLSFDQTIAVETYLAATMMDAFISCWDEKYRSNRIRPETYINRYIDARWQPLLQTPPFPEYTSGHSVISTAAAQVLTYLLGDNFHFTDNSEALFELPDRSFTSFNQAAAEAAISRMYGGIHFRDSIEKGQEGGKKIGEFVVVKLAKAGIKPVREELTKVIH
jgi:hypothetical protein